jgi:hypothetical protein
VPEAYPQDFVPFYTFSILSVYFHYLSISDSVCKLDTHLIGILNDAPVKGHAQNKSECVSGNAPPATLPPTPSPAPAPPGALNVLFFAVDDLRPEINAFSVDGGSPIPGTNVPKMHTPNIDALAAKSLVLTKNYVQQAVCSPTRASLLTGRRPDRTRTYDLYSYFRTVAANYTTIPEHFMQSGYQTIGMGKVGYVIY